MHWKHSNYQILYQILGNCHTVDEGYRVLCELEEDRDFSIKMSFVESYRAQAKVVTNKSILNSNDKLTDSLLFETEGNHLQAKAFIEEVKARTEMAQLCLDEARRELNFIRKCKELLDPYRTHKNLPLHEAHQKCQLREYYYDLLWKAYNHICSIGCIPSEHWMLIKMHPFHDKLTYRIGEFMSEVKNNASYFYSMNKEEVFSKDIYEGLLFVSNFTFTQGGIAYDHYIPKLTRRGQSVEESAE